MLEQLNNFIIVGLPYFPILAPMETVAEKQRAILDIIEKGSHA